KKGWFIQNDVSNQKYSGLTDGFNQSYWLWNAAIGKKFLKKQAGELKLSVFDLLKQNQSISRTVTGAYIEDVQSQVLQQYFMLTFSYSLKNFGVAARGNERNNQGREGMMGPRPGPGGMNPSF
ncbi:MAG: outer membrane beta-barrel protein, partial [Ferruginibacter sp.]